MQGVLMSVILAVHEETRLLQAGRVEKVLVPFKRHLLASFVVQVQFWYSIVVIAVMLSVHYVTANTQRGVVLWLPPLLQLLPAVARLFSPVW